MMRSIMESRKMEIKHTPDIFTIICPMELARSQNMIQSLKVFGIKESSLYMVS